MELFCVLKPYLSFDMNVQRNLQILQNIGVHLQEDHSVVNYSLL
jgi:hypothetical protein